MKKIIVLALLFSRSLFGEISPIYERGLQQISEKVILAATDKEKLSLIEKFNRWLKLVGNSELDSSELEAILKTFEPSLSQISDWTNAFQLLLHPNKKHHYVEVEIMGRKTLAYLNTYAYRSQSPYTEDEIQELLALEQYYYDKYKQHEEIAVSSLGDLKAGNYNFIVTLDQVIHICVHQELVARDLGDLKILISPNHSVLSHGGAVLTAGEIQVFGRGDGHVYVISNCSGHYQPDFFSLQEMESCLISLGVPKACIIKTAIPFENIGWKLMRYYEKNIQS